MYQHHKRFEILNYVPETESLQMSIRLLHELLLWASSPFSIFSLHRHFNVSNQKDV